MSVNKIEAKKRNAKPLTFQQKKERAEKKRESNRKAQQKRYESTKERSLLEKKMNKFKHDVAKALRLSNRDRTSLLLQFEDQSEKWEKFSLGSSRKMTPLKSFVLANTFAISVIKSKRFLEFRVSPRIFPMSYFPGAARFFTENNLLFWRIEAPVSQSLINGFCSLSESQAKVFRPALVLFTALLVTFLPVFPFGEEYLPHYRLTRFVFGSGVAVGDEEELDQPTNEDTFRQNFVPNQPVEEEEEEVDIGNLFGSEDEDSDRESVEEDEEFLF